MSFSENHKCIPSECGYNVIKILNKLIKCSSGNSSLSIMSDETSQPTFANRRWLCNIIYVLASMNGDFPRRKIIAVKLVFIGQLIEFYIISTAQYCVGGSIKVTYDCFWRKYIKSDLC